MFLVLLLQEQQPIFAFLLVLFVGSSLFLFLADRMAGIILLIQKLAARAQLEMVYVETILKIIGVSYIAEFAAQISKDAGQEALAAKMELAGKIIILSMAVPILTLLIETILTMIPGN
ncbi:Stage III sporulation protein AD [Bacillus thermotolerans]|uniref:Stage III sporulation protein AD n=1 Tax=Bacillus thermotolerans TaxID=1221996 RepID=A0A0F5IBQ5_BACTR|nr:Stage III sporulation protein AD [Bacillus thermotolerans]KKB42951.1 Stage III sporulation protein AD [Bacillus thermotolerans]KKB43859.1 Stage III sporulation protein AD [Bacillus thermotolerans]